MELEIGESARSRSDVLEGIRQMGSYGQEQATAEMAAVVSATPRPGVPSSLRVTRANQVKEHRFHRAATWQAGYWLLIHQDIPGALGTTVPLSH